jgi:hypothetical protein
MKQLVVALSVFALTTQAWAIWNPEPLASCEPCRMEEIEDWECLEVSEMLDIIEALNSAVGPDASAEARARAQYLINYALGLTRTFESRKALLMKYSKKYHLVLLQHCPNLFYF